MQNNAFNILQGQGFTNPNLSVRGVGGALPVGQYTDAATAIINNQENNKNITFNYFGNDPVPALPYIGSNTGIATLRDLWTVLSGGNNTQHSCYGTDTAGCTQVT